MKSKAPLVLMEQMVMILVFALATALCLQAFVKSDALSQRGEERDQAVLLCQSVAEAIQHNGGDLESALELVTGSTPGARDTQNLLFVDYDANWTPLADGVSAYRLNLRALPETVPGMGTAAVSVSGADGVLFELQVSWQEVNAHA